MTEILIAPMTAGYAADILTWRYPAPYDCYNVVDGDPGYYLDPGGGFFAVLGDGEFIGFRSFGPDGRVPGGTYDDTAPGHTVLDTGGGLRPELTGRGLGRSVIAAGLDKLLLAEPHALAQPEAMRRRAPAGRRDLHRTLPAEAAEADGEHRPHVFQPHGVVGMARPAAGLAHQPVPGAADGFLELQEIQHGGPQRIIASATSRRAARTSGSSVSGSIIAARTASRTSMPLSMRQAQ